ncbi:hypothetical protein Ssi03_06600 [Sphaerisporangium siamense]|uniref:Uncharacterized LabA/DUF88 family protein n=1 Tax=Sphaerisporangium siamense TaxID=795645 RepID=A0A7W7DH64_9ACTN|nr:NYN domain-containing protein [Sphaerisporangium siamense]MBB4705935.1 uncharacterized LabA/DUF88 family protein [Sphaerisporangium siamense]GII82670.1 hypothetical protein Ssi03_06600 [Sphaerisporangium siamense]
MPELAGIIFFWGIVADRVILFLDYQNVYKGARSCFHPGVAASHTYGQVHPIRLGRALVENSPYQRELVEVRVYRGRPAANRDPKGYGACMRQLRSWATDSRVEPITRSLRYPRGWPDRCQPGDKPQEKGIDVALAIDFVRLAMEGRYDVGILMSTDTDLKPALEIVDSMRGTGGPRPEVAAWSGDRTHTRRLAISGANIWCHWLDADVYKQVRDLTNYAVKS